MLIRRKALIAIKYVKLERYLQIFCSVPAQKKNKA